MPDWKIYFCNQFVIKTLFHATITYADIGSRKSLHIHSLKLFVQYASEIWTKPYDFEYTIHEIWAFDQKNRLFYNHFWQRVDAISEEVSVPEIIV